MALAGFLALSATSCQSLNQAIYGSEQASGGETRSDATPIAIESWTKDWLHCAESRCERWYEVVVAEAGELKADLYAPFAPGDPDARMLLETTAGERLPARSRRVESRRQLRYNAEPGTYRLKVVSRGDNQATFDYEVHLRLGPPAPVRKAARPPKSPPDVPLAGRPPVAPAPDAAPSRTTPEVPLAGTPETSSEVEQGPQDVPQDIPEIPEAAPAGAEPAATPGPSWVEAEVLDVEEVAGQARNVMIEAGEPDGLATGMRGVLVERGTEIGSIEIIEVYRNGSRARIVGPLSAPISFDTLSRIQVPPDGE